MRPDRNGMRAPAATRRDPVPQRPSMVSPDGPLPQLSARVSPLRRDLYVATRLRVAAGHAGGARAAASLIKPKMLTQPDLRH